MPSLPHFLEELWNMVNSTDELIKWSKLMLCYIYIIKIFCRLISFCLQKGDSFIILDEARFSLKVLKLHFKHEKMASFVRQLHMYGFHKVKTRPEFAHPLFLQREKKLLAEIKKKIPKIKDLKKENKALKKEVEALPK